MSVLSAASSATHGSSIFSSDNSSRTAVQERPGTSHSRSSHSTKGWAPQQASGFNSTTSFNPEGFYFPRPADDRIVEAQFLDMMNKRNWQAMPEGAKRQMMAYPTSKKWQLVHQDKLVEWQGEQKRRTNARNTVLSHDGIPSILSRADEEGSRTAAPASRPSIP